MKARGMSIQHVRMVPTCKAGAYYAAHTEEIDGSRVPIIVEGGGAEAWTSAVYYPSEDLANQQGDTKFEDLHYYQ